MKPVKKEVEDVTMYANLVINRAFTGAQIWRLCEYTWQCGRVIAPIQRVTKQAVEHEIGQGSRPS